MTQRVHLHRSADRYVTRTPGIETWHSFSFGPHYDPANTSYGALLLHDEHRLDPGAGFGPHPHRDVDIVSWVLDGELVHEDEHGRTVVAAGRFQRLVTGSRTVHAERAGPAGTRFVQLWLTPAGEPASYEHGAWPAQGVTRADGTSIDVVQLSAGAELVLPEAPLVHVFVGRGSVVVGESRLEQGDSARVAGSSGCTLGGRTPAQLLLVAMHSTREAE